jgi:hypothetical protein
MMVISATTDDPAIAKVTAIAGIAETKPSWNLPPRSSAEIPPTKPCKTTLKEELNKRVSAFPKNARRMALVRLPRVQFQAIQGHNDRFYFAHESDVDTNTNIKINSYINRE